MADLNQEKNQPRGSENSAESSVPNRNQADSFKVDAIKTGNDKQKRYYDQPFDEQMYGSFDELREQEAKENKGDSE